MRYANAGWRWSLGGGLLAMLMLAGAVRADEPGFLSKDRWAALTEVQYAELKAAEDLFAKKNYKAARNAYEKYQTVHKTSEVVSYCQLMMAESVRMQGKPNDAITDYQFVRDLAPDSDDAKWAHFRIALCHQEAGNFEKSLAAYQETFKVNGMHPTAFWALVNQVEILDGQHKWRERLPVWQQMVERFEKQRIEPRAYARAVEGLTYDRIGSFDMEGAMKLLQSIQKEEEAQAHFISMARRVISELGQGKMGKNLRTGKNGKPHGGKNEWKPGKGSPVIVVDPAKERENHAQAEKIAKFASDKAWAWVVENPKRANHRQLVKDCIDILITAGKEDDGVARALEARKIYADDQWTFELICALYTSLDRLNDAIGQATAARRVHKDADWSLDLYANLVLESGDIAKAVVAWDQMKDKKAALTATSEALLKTKMPEAIERRRKIAELDPKESTNVFMWTGKAYEQAKMYQEAIEEYRQAANEPANLYAIAKCLSSMKKYREAIGQYSAIGSVFEKETGNALYMAALEYEKLGENDTAIKILRRVCRAYYKSSPKSASAAHVRLADKYKIEETLGGDSGKEPG